MGGGGVGTEHKKKTNKTKEQDKHNRGNRRNRREAAARTGLFFSARFGSLGLIRPAAEAGRAGEARGSSRMMRPRFVP